MPDTPGNDPQLRQTRHQIERSTRWPYRVNGMVERIYPSEGGTYIRLDIPAAERPKDGYFRLDTSHANYNALYSLALVAAVNRYRLTIRTKNDITPTEHAEVAYMVVDW